MTMQDIMATFFMVSGAIFFLAGTVGLLRFPDVFTRLHALTKADNLGLGLIVAGLVLRHADLAIAGKLALVWFLIILASSSACYLVADAALRSGLPPREGKK